MGEHEHAPGLEAVEVRAKSGDEQLTFRGEPVGARLSGFWSWACSDLVGNALRGMLAEYIVATALGCVDSCGRREWDAYDLCTPEGVRVEVKSSAYLQSWRQDRPSTVTFTIAETLGWEQATNTYATERKRQADVYVFCVLAHQDKASLDPLQLDQGDFYVATTDRLNEAVGGQKTITLGSLLRQVQPDTATFRTLRGCVAMAAESMVPIGSHLPDLSAPACCGISCKAWGEPQQAGAPM